VANKANNGQATEHTRFRIGSISKMFVGLAALKLVEEGKLDLQTPIKALIPEIEFTNPYAQTHPVRVIHLLQHTAGWDDIHLPEYANNDPSPLTVRQGLDFHPHSRASRWRPGERMSYSNSGHTVVAYIIQTLTNMDFEEYVTEHFFKPLNMQSATYRQPPVGDGKTATLYVKNEPVEYWHITMRPSGAINASAADMANYLQFLLNNGKFNQQLLLSESSIKTMEKPASTLAAEVGLQAGYGIANFTSNYKTFQFHGHNGGVAGGASELSYLNEHDIGLYVAINTNSRGLRDIVKAIKAYLVQNISSIKYPRPEEISEATISQYSGFYMPVNPRNEMQRFISQIAGVRELQFATREASLSSGEKDVSYLAVSQKLFRTGHSPHSNLALLADKEGLAIQVGNQYFQKISSLRHYFQTIMMWLFIGLLVAHLLWFFLWISRRLLGKISKGPSMQIRIWPFFSSLSIAAMISAVMAGQAIDAFKMLGELSFYSVTVTLATYSFAICTIAGLVQNIRYFNHHTHWFSRYFCLFSSIIFTLATIYFISFDIIGLRTYA
jgi:CubicO group peptidase (beta-lactamase class C family)